MEHDNTAHLSERLRLLMSFAKSKRADGVVCMWKTIAELLADEYGSGMGFSYVMHHILAAFNEAMSEPKFQLRRDATAIEEMVMAPIKGYFAVELYGATSLSTKYTIESFYESMIKHVLSELRFARMDWCREWLQNSAH